MYMLTQPISTERHNAIKDGYFKHSIGHVDSVIMNPSAINSLELC